VEDKGRVMRRRKGERGEGDVEKGRGWVGGKRK
jgi:hypothetical protein